MAQMTPNASGGTYYVEPRKGVVSNIHVNTSATTAAGTNISDRSNLILSKHYFENVDDDDTWDGSSTIPPPRKPIAVAWKGDTTDADHARVTITQVGGENQDAIIHFEVASSGRSGWVYVLSQR